MLIKFITRLLEPQVIVKAAGDINLAIREIRVSAQLIVEENPTLVTFN